MKSKLTGRGGPGRGQGRKPKGTGNRIKLNIRIDPATAVTIKAEAHRLNISQGELIDQWATATRAGQPGGGSEE